MIHVIVSLPTVARGDHSRNTLPPLLVLRQNRFKNLRYWLHVGSGCSFFVLFRISHLSYSGKWVRALICPPGFPLPCGLKWRSRSTLPWLVDLFGHLLVSTVALTLLHDRKSMRFEFHVTESDRWGGVAWAVAAASRISMTRRPLSPPLVCREGRYDLANFFYSVAYREGVVGHWRQETPPSEGRGFRVASATRPDPESAGGE